MNKDPKGHKNRPYTPASFPHSQGYMALWILSIIAFTIYSFKSHAYQYPETRLITAGQVPGRNSSILIASPEAERKAVMTANTDTTGHDLGNAHKNKYVNVYSGKAICSSQSINKKGMQIMQTIDQFGISKEGRITIKDGDIEVRLFNLERVNLNVHSRKLLDMLLMKLSFQLPYGEQATRSSIVEKFDITITLNEFMELCALSDRKNAREQFRAAAEALFSLYMTFDYEVWEETGRRRKRTQKHFSSYLLDSTEETRTLEKDPVIDSRICVAFSVKLLEYLCTRYIMPVNIKIFTINPHKNPHAYNIARHLSEVYRVRMKKGQPPRISVEALLKACPELPAVDEVREKGNREYWQKIYEPVQRDLDAICDIYGLVDWHYTHSNGERLSDKELGLNGEKGYSFDEWLNFMIDFTLPDYPDSTHRVKKHQSQKRGGAAKKD